MKQDKQKIFDTTIKVAESIINLYTQKNNIIMKPTLNQEIESSQKGIDYVDSLVPMDQNCIDAYKRQKFIDNYRKCQLKQIVLEIKWGKRMLIVFMLFLISVFLYKTFINP